MSSHERTDLLHLKGKTRFAGIDIGSHTTRMLVVRKEGNELLPMRTERRVTRLAHGFQDAHAVSEEAQERNISAMQEYAVLLRELEVEHIACGATGVVRRAQNAAAILDRVAGETGIKGMILSEETEAFLSTKGMMSVLPEPGEKNLLAFDIGGGSTEFLLVLSGDSSPVWISSRPIGAATITESYLAGDPPGDESVRQAIISSREKILSAREQMYATMTDAGIIPNSLQLQLAGTAGTVSTLAAMYLEMDRYVPYRVNGVELSQEWLSGMIRLLSAMPLAGRRLIKGLEPGREEIILGGAIITSEILACFKEERFAVTDAGLLEGLLLELVEEEAGLSVPGFPSLRTSLTWRLQKG
ncbi:MAG: hypothetical protein AB9866_12320 [Syntrophobacteraceae bacterium]